jgi:hypothetical protein
MNLDAAIEPALLAVAVGHWQGLHHLTVTGKQKRGGPSEKNQTLPGTMECFLQRKKWQKQKSVSLA